MSSQMNWTLKNAINEHRSKAKKPLKELVVIPVTSKWKAIFDVFILFCVGFSCVFSMYHVSFPKTSTNPNAFTKIDSVLEYFFWLDLILNFLQSYKHPDTNNIVIDLKQIAKNYVFNGWFFIDFVSVFPFEDIFPSGSMTKLFRLFRLPRLIKLIDISKFQKVLKSLMNNKGRDEKIIT